MSVRITSPGKAALYDSTSDIAFGPVFESNYEAAEFLEWMEAEGRDDPRVFMSHRLAELKAEFEAWRDREPSDTQIYGAGVS